MRNPLLFTFITLSLLLTPVVAGAQDYTFTTLAGLAGSSGSADGTGSAARFNFPSALELNSAGNLYVVDSGNNTIRVGSLRSIIAPRLQITRSGVQVILSWPATAGFGLETSTSLSPGTLWIPLTAGMATVGGQFVFTNNVGAATAFYRLRKP